MKITSTRTNNITVTLYRYCDGSLFFCAPRLYFKLFHVFEDLKECLSSQKTRVRKQYYL